MSEWKELTIPEFTDVISGATPATNVKEYWDGEIEWVTPVDLSKLNSRFLKSTIRKISKRGLENSSTSLIPAYNVVMSSRAPIGYFAIPTKDFTTNQGCKSFKLYPQQDAEYHYYNFLLNINYFKRFGSGSTFAEISKTDIEKLSFTIPTSLPEQRKIARILSTVDAVIEKTEAAIAKYKAIKAGMMADLFTRGIDLTTGKLRPRYQEAPELYKQSELGMVPKEWEVNPLGHYLQFISYGFTNPMPETESGPYMITAANIFNGEVQILTSRKTSIINYDLLTAKSKPIIGDVLITKDGTLGRLGFVKNSNICINQSVAIMRYKEKCDPLFFKLLLETTYYQNRIIFDAGGSTIKHIYITKLDKMPIGCPKNNDELKWISSIAENINSMIEYQSSVLEKYVKLKQALMSDLLTGKVRVKYEEDIMEAA